MGQALVDIVVEELADVVKEEERINLIELGGLGQCLVLGDVDQSEVLCHPLHEVCVFFGYSCEFWRVDWQT
jgi:hypothetical protein